jgi:hypothetical protein
MGTRKAGVSHDRQPHRARKTGASALAGREIFANLGQLTAIKPAEPLGHAF